MTHCKTKINPIKSRLCKSCKLYINQFPLTENKAKADVFWVGLSAVQVNDDDEYQIPLSPSTRSGKLIEDIEKQCNGAATFLKTNLVKCLPLNENKIRYPEKLEMDKCYPNLTNELEKYSPKIVFLLGRQVSIFTLKKYGFQLPTLGLSFKYEGFEVNGTIFIPIHHPSYILVYKRKFVENYISGIQVIVDHHVTTQNLVMAI